MIMTAEAESTPLVGSSRNSTDGRFASASDSMLRGCRLEIPHGTEDDHERRPCSTMDHTYVDELPEERIRDLDLSNKLVHLDLPTHAPTFAPVPMPTVSSALVMAVLGAQWGADEVRLLILRSSTPFARSAHLVLLSEPPQGCVF